MKDAKKILEETLTWPSLYPNLFNKVNLRLRSGVLLYGPPGCGKTLLANAVSAYCQLNFISVKVCCLVLHICSNPDLIMRLIFNFSITFCLFWYCFLKQHLMKYWYYITFAGTRAFVQVYWCKWAGSQRCFWEVSEKNKSVMQGWDIWKYGYFLTGIELSL